MVYASRLGWVKNIGKMLSIVGRRPEPETEPRVESKAAGMAVTEAKNHAMRREVPQ